MSNFTFAGISIPKNENPELSLVPSGLNYEIDDENTDVLKYLMISVLENRATILKGPKGTGKTYALQYLAQQTNNPLLYLQLNGATGIDSFVGKWIIDDHGTRWVDGALTIAMKNGYWLALDELNFALPEITAVLHSVLDERKTLYLEDRGKLPTDTDNSNFIIKAHPNFRVFAAINPEEDYAGAKELNMALLDRFLGMLYVDYPSAQKEEKILLNHKAIKIDNKPQKGRKNGILTRLVKAANGLRILHKNNDIDFQCSTRTLIDWAIYCYYLPVMDAIKPCILDKTIHEDKEKILKEIRTFFTPTEQWGKDINIEQEKNAIEKDIKEDLSF